MNDLPLVVVVVDDEPQITELLKTYIESLPGHHNVHAFNDPEEARAFLLQNTPDVLVTDLNMPKFNGIQLLSLVPGNATRIIISGFVPEITESRLAAFKASFLEKPVSLKELGAMILRAGEGKQGKPCGS